MVNKDTLPTRQKDDFVKILENMFKLFGKSWSAFLLNIRTFVGIFLVPIAAVLVFMFLPLLVAGSFKDAGAKGGMEWLGIASGGLLAAFLFFVLLLALIYIVIWSTVAVTFTQIASARGKKIGFKEVFSKSRPFIWKFLGLLVLIVLLAALGFIALIIPGILILFFVTFAVYIMVDQKVGIEQSLRDSYEMVKKNWKVIMALYVLQVTINIPSLVPLLGEVVTLALSIVYFCLPAIIYDRCKITAK